ncbi:MAG: cell wall hydrolase [Xanthobacteraceae bacterium]
MTTSIGYQGLAALVAKQPQVAATVHQSPPPAFAAPSFAASPFATIRAATISLPQPLGTAMPQPPRLILASYDPGDRDVTGSIRGGERRNTVRAVAVEALTYPTVDRSRKGDRLIQHWGPQPPADREVTSAPDQQPLEDRDLQREVLEAIAHDRQVAAQPARPDRPEDLEAAVRFEPFPEFDISLSLEAHPQTPDDMADPTVAEAPDMSILDEAANPDATARTSHLFFGSPPMASTGSLEPWGDGEEPVLMTPESGDIKQAALAPVGRDAPADEGVTVAGKGEVTGDGHRPRSPAEHLGLAGDARVKAERCLTDAIYFEARGESVRGQIAVAQVVLNRAFSGYYPHDVCGVVYQNAQRHLACQFTFACDGRSKAIREPDAFERASRISKAALDGTVWLPQVGRATHYHAYWVHPGWTRGMSKLDRIGVHTFYRPRQWGDGANKPAWGTPQSTAEVAAKL